MNKFLSDRFLFATSIENSYPTILLPNGTVKRIDELEKTDHYKQWSNDLDLVKSLGITHLRYGPPYYKTHLSPGNYDWQFTDIVFNQLNKLGIIPIVDLCHFGVPDWIGNFQNPDFPAYFAEYAQAFAERFAYLQYFTPVNEIFITATFSGLYGWWNERLTSEKGFVTALKNCCKANVMAMQAILKVQPQAVFIQSESSEFFHPSNPDAQKIANFLNEKRFLSLDLTYGYPLTATMYEYLLETV